MTRFGTGLRLPVRAPFRLDLTADALRRLPVNSVDVVSADGTLYRALRDERGAALLAMHSAGSRALEVRATGRDARRWLPTVERMLGTRVDLAEWYARSEAIGWLRPLARALRGLKPPRYPSLWEACTHAVIFQQLSLHAAAAIMQRLVRAIGEPVSAAGIEAYEFPGPQRLLETPTPELRAAGLSKAKVVALRGIALELLRGTVDEGKLDGLPTPQAGLELQRLPGVGPWSAAVVLLRGLGRLDTFPPGDSGVARSLGLAGGREVDLDATLRELGPVRGMVYFHLLLGRLGKAAL